METEWLGGVDPWLFRRSALVHPQPVAVASSRLADAQTRQQVIEEAVKATEVLTRYLAGLSLASWTARQEEQGGSIELPTKSLSFGDFLTIVQRLAGTPSHPLYSAMFMLRPGKKGKGDAAITAVLKLRNQLGHELSAISPAQAVTITESVNPVACYAEALEHVETILQYPLFVPEQSVYERGHFKIARVILMGASSNHVTDMVTCDLGIDESGFPHISVDGKILVLPPFVGWKLIRERQNYELALLDSITEFDVQYRTMYANKVSDTGTAVAMREFLTGRSRRVAKTIHLVNGKSLDATWSQVRVGLENVARQMIGGIPWERYDRDSLRWFANQLDRNNRDPQTVVRSVLLDGQITATEAELRQLDILLGRIEVVKAVLKRPVLDMRDMGDGAKGLVDRKEVHGNVITALRDGIEFVAARLRLADVSPENMTMMDGGPDYIAIREGLVNQFSHQDYNDARAAAQITLSPGKTIFFNPGFSLLGDARLQEGGRSLQRNPVIARALKLMGWAESAGTGIQRVYETWQRANRRPPGFESHETNNTFTLELTWDAVVGDISAAWKNRLGVELTGVQAKVLEFIIDAGAPTLKVIANSNSLNFTDTDVVLRFLVLQGLVFEQGFRFQPSTAVKNIARKIRKT